MLQKVINTIEKYKMISNNDKVIVGVSGGPDSLALLHILKSIQNKYNFRLYAAHVNHNLREEESKKDELFVKKTCNEWGIPLYIENANIYKISKERKLTLEETGREVRYNYFNEIMKKIDAQRIAVAHNANDNAETILMNMIRGSGLDGLSGINPVRDYIIRPLIKIERCEIEEYCKVNELNPRIDSSNLDKVYIRNKVRLELIPYIKKEFNQSIIGTINRMGQLISNDSAYIQEHVSKILDEVIIKQAEEYISINLDKISRQSSLIIPRVIRGAIKRLLGHLTEFEHINIEQVINLINFGRVGSTICLPKGLKVVKSYKEIIITTSSDIYKEKRYNYFVNIPDSVFINETNGTLISEVVKVEDIETELDNYTQLFDYDKINGDLYIRNRNTGDIFSPKGMKGTKKLKEYFIDEKIPRHKRCQIPVVAIGNEIVWIIGYRPSQKYLIDNNTTKVLILKYLHNFQ